MSRSPLVLSALLLAGCASTSTTHLKPSAPRGRSCGLEVSQLPPSDRRFEEVCVVSARGGISVFESLKATDLIETMKGDACECGADALVLRELRDGHLNLILPATGAEATAVGIRYLDEEDPPRRAHSSKRSIGDDQDVSEDSDEEVARPQRPRTHVNAQPERAVGASIR